MTTRATTFFPFPGPLSSHSGRVGAMRRNAGSTGSDVADRLDTFRGEGAIFFFS